MSRHSKLIGAFSNSASVKSMNDLIEVARESVFEFDDVLELAETLSNSGERLNWPEDTNTADLASTGGPSSLSTLIAPLYLLNFGFVVPKLGVPGRPAGGIDALAQLPGFRSHLTTAQISKIVARCNYAHFLADRTFAPLDAHLFKYRQKVGAQNIPSLAAASLLAKKLACGVTNVGLDVRVARHGNFGQNFTDARRAAQLFCKAAAAAQIQAVAILTNAEVPYQPYIGRAEALLALRLIADEQPPTQLAKHAYLCRQMAEQIAASDSQERPFNGQHLRSLLANHISAQGSNIAELNKKAERTIKSHRHKIQATSSGFLTVDLEALRNIFVEVNSCSTNEFGKFPDKLGVILSQPSGTWLQKGKLLATVRASTPTWNVVSTPLAQSICTTADKPNLENGFEVVNALN